MKHLLPLYPRSWRRRYGAEIAALLERRRAGLGEVVDLIRGALSARLQPALGTPQVYVPGFGFRPAGTRAIAEIRQVEAAGVRVRVLAVAAGPALTELKIEWEPLRGVCGVEALEPSLTSTLRSGALTSSVRRIERREYASSGWSIRHLVFPPLDAGVAGAELELS